MSGSLQACEKNIWRKTRWWWQSSLPNSFMVTASDSDIMQSFLYSMWDYSPHALDMLIPEKNALTIREYLMY